MVDNKIVIYVISVVALLIPGIARSAGHAEKKDNSSMAIALVYYALLLTGAVMIVSTVWNGGDWRSSLGVVVIIATLLVNAADIFGFKFFGLMPNNKNKYGSFLEDRIPLPPVKSAPEPATKDQRSHIKIWDRKIHLVDGKWHDLPPDP